MKTIAAFLGGLAAVGLLVWYVMDLRGERDILREQVAAQAETIQQAQNERAALEQALLARQAAHQQAEKERDAALAKIEEVMRNDAAANAWGDTVIPDSLRGVW